MPNESADAVITWPNTQFALMLINVMKRGSCDEDCVGGNVNKQRQRDRDR